jgi:alkylation response protein AidB-like acyl-CoA dehydrogenase
LTITALDEHETSNRQKSCHTDIRKHCCDQKRVAFGGTPAGTLICMAKFAGVDYLLIDSLLSEQELLVRQTARQFVEDRVIPIIKDCFREARFPKELIPELGRLGFLGANLEGYGCAGMSNVEYGLVMQELVRADSGS